MGMFMIMMFWQLLPFPEVSEGDSKDGDFFMPVGWDAIESDSV